MKNLVRLGALAVLSLSIVACGSPRMNNDASPDGLDGARVDAVVSTDGMDSTNDIVTPDAVADTVNPDVVAPCDGSVCGASCVDLATDPHHCGSCANDCTTLAHVDGAITCVAGSCNLTTGCATGFAHCGTTASTGCETNINDPAHCGDCTTACAEPTPMCTANPAGGFHCANDCAAPTGTRCESQCVNATTDPLHCGSCTNACPVPTSDGHATCTDSACGIACDAGFHACGNACSSNTAVATCGTSCTPCSVPAHAIATCSATGTCGFTCDTGFADCDNDPANGCEVDTTSSIASCGTCGHACSNANGTPNCTNGTCAVACTTGFADCDNDPANGCEVDTNNSVASCGACGNACTAANGTPSCANGSCGIGACNASFGDCDNNTANGCETDLSSTIAACGACNQPCVIANGAGVCANGMCGVASCAPGFADCDNNPVSGCETNISASPMSCGACGMVCNLANATAACAAGMCVIGACRPGFADCDNNPANGCEVNIAADAGNCGGCGTQCTAANGTSVCSNGACRIGSCNAGFADCNNIVSDGCEINTRTSVNNCGACNAQCFVANGTSACSNGACAVASCNAGFGNCDGVPANGCETNVTTSNTNCGVCGNSCATACFGNVTGTTCSAGACAITGCSAARYNIDGVCSNGCECTTSGTSASCAAPSSLGTLQVGQSTTYTGNLVPAGQEAYLTVTFAGDTNISYHPHVRMTAGASQFALDVLTNCAGSAMACGTEGGNSVNRTDWEVVYTGGDPNNPVNFNPIPPVGSNGIVIIHVYRRAGQPVTCGTYTITVSN